MQTATAVDRVQGSLMKRASRRVEAVAQGDGARLELIGRSLRIAVDGLPRMFRSDVSQFAFTRKRMPNGRVEPVGQSVRYGAMTALGASFLDEQTQRPIFGGQTAFEWCGRMLGGVNSLSNWGDIAVLAWAASELSHPEGHRAIERLVALQAIDQECETVIAAWVLAALLASRRQSGVEQLIAPAFGRLARAWNQNSGLFHCRTDKSSPKGRAHIACFADQVYPVQSLARYHRVCGDGQAIEMANRCAQQICSLQGSAGQWWWHYDARMGVVVEGYPVYSVHQHAMAPMALLELSEAGGFNAARHVGVGVDWLALAPEIGADLFDESEVVIWRKVGRTDPKKVVRKIKAAASRVRPHWRARLLDRVFPPRRIDFECRPYEFGWMLYAWLYNRPI